MAVARDVQTRVETPMHRFWIMNVARWIPGQWATRHGKTLVKKKRGKRKSSVNKISRKPRLSAADARARARAISPGHSQRAVIASCCTYFAMDGHCARDIIVIASSRVGLFYVFPIFLLYYDSASRCSMYTRARARIHIGSISMSIATTLVCDSIFFQSCEYR